MVESWAHWGSSLHSDREAGISFPTRCRGTESGGSSLSCMVITTGSDVSSWTCRCGKLHSVYFYLLYRKSHCLWLQSVIFNDFESFFMYKNESWNLSSLRLSCCDWRSRGLRMIQAQRHPLLPCNPQGLRISILDHPCFVKNSLLVGTYMELTRNPTDVSGFARQFKYHCKMMWKLTSVKLS